MSGTTTSLAGSAAILQKSSVQADQVTSTSCPCLGGASICIALTQARTTMFIHVYSQLYFWDVTELSMDDAHVVYVTVVLDSCMVRCSLCSAHRWSGGVVNWCTCFSYVHVLPSYSLLASSPPNHICTENAYVLLPNVISCLGGVYDTNDLCPC